MCEGLFTKCESIVSYRKAEPAKHEHDTSFQLRQDENIAIQQAERQPSQCIEKQQIRLIRDDTIALLLSSSSSLRSCSEWQHPVTEEILLRSFDPTSFVLSRVHRLGCPSGWLC